jgi:hypothetical protein
MKVVNEGIEGNVCSAKHDILKEEKKLEAWNLEKVVNFLW